jgi:hypothetical protein
MAEAPEQKARREIDADLIAAGWLVQNRDELDLTAGRGIAVREFPMKSGYGSAVRGRATKAAHDGAPNDLITLGPMSDTLSQ